MNELGRRICDGLGIDSLHVVRVDLRIEADRQPLIMVTRKLTDAEAGAIPAHVSEFHVLDRSNPCTLPIDLYTNVAYWREYDCRECKTDFDVSPIPALGATVTCPSCSAIVDVRDSNTFIRDGNENVCVTLAVAEHEKALQSLHE